MIDVDLAENVTPLNLLKIYDVIHGNIETKDLWPVRKCDTLNQIINTAAFRRLQNIRQIGFASHTFIAADHSRYAHALGTMQMMRRLYENVFLNSCLKDSDSFWNDLNVIDSELFPQRERDSDKLFQHMLVAALVQDIGELPFQPATHHYIVPGKHFVNSIGQHFNLEDDTVEGFVPKIQFTLGCLASDEYKAILNQFSIPLLLYLLARGFVSSDKSGGLTGEAKALLHMLDGVIDADRLDYVHRDSFHSLGAFAKPEDLISTIVEYDANGPIVADPSLASAFIVQRSHLHSNVYLAPTTRFRIILLLEVFSSISKVRKEDGSIGLKMADGNVLGKLPCHISFEEFLRLDDIAITSFLSSLQREEYARDLGPKGKEALCILQGKGREYKFNWLPKTYGADQVDGKRTLPTDLFYDTYEDKRHIVVYRQGSIRVKSPVFTLLNGVEGEEGGDTIPLEKCSGFYSGILNSLPVLPMDDSIMIFIPQDRGSTKLDHLLKNGIEKLYPMILTSSVHSRDKALGLSRDTSDLDGFSQPTVFISYSQTNHLLAYRVMSLLHRLRIKYIILLEDGEGQTVDRNIKQALDRSDLVFAVLSDDYLDRAEDSKYVLFDEVLMFRDWVKQRDESSFNRVLPLTSGDVDHSRVKKLLRTIGVSEKTITFPVDQLPDYLLEKKVWEYVCQCRQEKYNEN